VLKVGLTGGIATGKSTVLEVFREQGAVTFDADLIARDVVRPGQPALAEVVRAFGAEVLAADGSLDRARLASIIFADPARRVELESILHPRIIAEQDRRIRAALDEDPAAIVVVDAALMVETGSFRRFDALVVVRCDNGVQLSRLMRRDHLDEAEARRRVAAQLPQAEKERLADYIIDSSGSLEATRRQAVRVWTELAARNAALGRPCG
jgi:dephospho-CoA kinase